MTTENIPEVDIKGGVYTWRWKAYGIRATLERFYEDSRYNTTAEAVISLDPTHYPEISHHHLLQDRVNLTSARAKKQLSNLLAERYQINGESPIPWPSIVEQLCVLTVRQLRIGEPVVEVGNNPPRTEQRWQLYPLLRKGQPTVVYGEGGFGKSMLATVCALLVATGAEEAGLRPELDNVLYLDYEQDPDTLNERIKALKSGLGGLDLASIKYRYCHQMLHAEAQELQHIVADNDIGLIIVDSMTGATAGKVQDNDINTALFNSLRSLKCTALLIDHERKNDPAGPIGAITKYNRARSVWNVKRVQEPGSDELKMGLYHTKVNDGKKMKPMGLQFTFGGDDPPSSIAVERINVADVPELQTSMSVPERIAHLLGEGAMAINQIHGEIASIDPKITESQVRVALSRGKGTRFVNLERGTWGLLSKGAS